MTGIPILDHFHDYVAAHLRYPQFLFVAFLLAVGFLMALVLVIRLLLRRNWGELRLAAPFLVATGAGALQFSFTALDGLRHGAGFDRSSLCACVCYSALALGVIQARGAYRREKPVENERHEKTT